MISVRGVFDGQKITLIDRVNTRRKTNVLVIFPDNVANLSPEEARTALRGRGKGGNLTQKLLQKRAEDLKLERK